MNNPLANHFEDFEGDLHLTGVRGSLRKARRVVNCRKEGTALKRKRNRACRTAVRQALRTGEEKVLSRFLAGTSWDLS